MLQYVIAITTSLIPEGAAPILTGQKLRAVVWPPGKRFSVGSGKQRARMGPGDISVSTFSFRTV